MPDLQTEMQKILQSWDQPETTETTQQLETTEETTVFTTTTNTSRATFEIVRDEPGLPKKQYIRMLETKGFKKASTTSLLSQMIRQGYIWVDSSGCLRPNQTEYKPLKSVTTLKNKAKKANPVKTSKLRTSKEPSKEALAAAAEAMSSIGMNGLIEVPVRTNIEVILDTITLSEAHELYSKLHRYFGGLPK
jgi:hypothetical protein